MRSWRIFIDVFPVVSVHLMDARCVVGWAGLGWELAIFRLLGKNTENIWEMEERGYRFIQLLFFISSSWTAEN